MKQKTRIAPSFTAPQAAWLLAEAERLGISISELIRRIIDEKRNA